MRCKGCNKPTGKDDFQDLCQECLSAIFEEDIPQCRLCGKEGIEDICRPCLDEDTYEQMKND